MPQALRYIVDDNGRKSSVLVPVKVWEDLNSNYRKLQNKLNVLNSLKEGLAEIEHSKKTGKKLQAFKDFLK